MKIVWFYIKIIMFSLNKKISLAIFIFHDT